MKQIHIRRFLSLLLAALTLWAAAVTAGSDSAAAALQQLRQGSRLPQQALRWELGDFFGLDSLSAVTVMTLAQSPLLLAGRSTVAALLSAGVTRDPPEPAAPESPDTPSPSADPSLTDALTSYLLQGVYRGQRRISEKLLRHGDRCRCSLRRQLCRPTHR